MLGVGISVMNGEGPKSAIAAFFLEGRAVSQGLTWHSLVPLCRKLKAAVAMLPK